MTPANAAEHQVQSNLGEAKGIVREEDEDGVRWYPVDGIPHISVTQVLSWFVPPELKKWFVNNSAKKIEARKEETAKQGTEIHAQAANGTEDRLNKLFSESGMEPLANEFMVAHKLGWAGQVDLKARYNGKVYLIDIKTGRFGHAGMQLGAYTLAVNSCGGNVQGIGVISLSRETERPAQFFDYSEHFDESLYAWCAAFDTWKYLMCESKKTREKIVNLPWFNTRTTTSFDWRTK